MPPCDDRVGPPPADPRRRRADGLELSHPSGRRPDATGPTVVMLERQVVCRGDPAALKVEGMPVPKGGSGSDALWIRADETALVQATAMAMG